MTSDQTNQCHIAIHTAATTAAAVGGGLAQLPGSDNIPLLAIQISMAIALGKIFGIQVSETVGRGMVMTAVASMTGPVVARTISQWIFGWIPAAENVVNATTAAGITEAIGWTLADEFDEYSNDDDTTAF